MIRFRNSSVLFLLLAAAVASTGLAIQPNVETYDQLLQAIRQTRAASELRIEQAVAQEKVREAWETGKLIDEHVLLHKERAEYGRKVIVRLAKDLGTSETDLRYMLQFARTYPIHQPADELTWSHYVELLSLNDDAMRQEVATQAVREHWSRNQIRAEVRNRKAKEGKPQEIVEKLAAEPGQLNTYRVVKAEAGPLKGQLVLDLGFANYFQPEGIEQFNEGNLVNSVQRSADSVPRNSKLELAKTVSAVTDLFTYKAYVTKVLDGDTFDAVIDLGFKIMTLQKLRLRGLDAPEILSAEGKEAKAFLEKKFTAAQNEILIKTSKSDKYDRYLADVWAGDTYLNQALLDKSLAIVMKD